MYTNIVYIKSVPVLFQVPLYFCVKIYFWRISIQIGHFVFILLNIRIYDEHGLLNTFLQFWSIRLKEFLKNS